MQNPIIAALDVPTAEQALKLATDIAPAVGAFKIGKELFTSAGPDIVKRVRDTGASVFLDLKFHDIPNTVAKAETAHLERAECRCKSGRGHHPRVAQCSSWTQTATGKTCSFQLKRGKPAKLDGGLAGTRTPDQCLKRALLYQLSYQPTNGMTVNQPW